MDDHDDLTRRIRDLGSEPLDSGLTAKCLHVMRAQRPRRLNLTKFKIATAAISGFLLGSVGLASAGTLPAPAQNVAHSVLKTVGVNVPAGHDRFNDPTVCPGGPYRNHGAYVRAHKDDPNAGASPCGKPNRAVQGADESKGTDETGTPGHGPPPWARGNGKGSKDDTDPDEKNRDPGTAPAPTTTVPMAPTTTSPPPTTTPPTSTTAPATTTTNQP
jgi:hypothetical protein